MTSEPGAVCGPGQPERVWSHVHAANTLGADRPQTGSASVAGAGRGGTLQAQAGPGREMEGGCQRRDPQPGESKG